MYQLMMCCTVSLCRKTSREQSVMYAWKSPCIDDDDDDINDDAYI